MKMLLEIISQVRKLKTNQQLSLKTPLSLLTIASDQQKELQQHEQLLKGVTQAEKIAYVSTGNTQLIKKEDQWQATIHIGK